MEEDTIIRQSNELELLDAMYPGEINILQAPSDAPNNAAEGEVEVIIDPSHTLTFTLPKRYPATSKPTVSLSFAETIPNTHRKLARAELCKILDDQPKGVECIDLIVVDFKQRLQTSLSSKPDDHNNDDNDTSNSATTPLPPPSSEPPSQNGKPFLRLLIWTHHLLSPNKRSFILSQSKVHLLSGFSKPGYPGAIYIEGATSSVRTFVRELKALRWQAIQERGEEAVEERLLLKGMVEVEKMSDVVEGLEEAYGKGEEGRRVVAFFLEGMKIK